MQVRGHHLRRHIIDTTNAVPTLHIPAELTDQRYEPRPRLFRQRLISDESRHHSVDKITNRSGAGRRSLRHVGTP
jgi:hypothetical protein